MNKCLVFTIVCRSWNYCNKVFDKTTGKMLETSNGGGHFTDVTLNPIVTVI